MLLWDVLIILHPTLEQMREIWIIGAPSSAPAAAAPPAGLVPSHPSLLLAWTSWPHDPADPLGHLSPALPKELRPSGRSSHTAFQRSIFLAGREDGEQQSHTSVPQLFWVWEMVQRYHQNQDIHVLLRDCGIHAPDPRIPCQAQAGPLFCSVPCS